MPSNSRSPFQIRSRCAYTTGFLRRAPSHGIVDRAQGLADSLARWSGLLQDSDTAPAIEGKKKHPLGADMAAATAGGVLIHPPSPPGLSPSGMSDSVRSRDACHDRDAYHIFFLRIPNFGTSPPHPPPPPPKKK